MEFPVRLNPGDRFARNFSIGDIQPESKKVLPMMPFERNRYREI